MNKILQALKEGNYTIKKESDCRCYFDWYIKNGELQYDISNDECWVVKVLYVDNEAVAQQSINEPLEVLTDEFNTEEFIEMIEANNLYPILNQLSFDNNEANITHNQRMYESLVRFINENSYSCYIKYPRNFNNEYDCILTVQGINIDDAEEVSSEKFAQMYLQEDNEVTQYYKGFEFIK